MIEYKIKDKIQTHHAKLFGFVEKTYQKIIFERMTSDFAVETVLAEAEAPFFTRTDDDYAPVGLWRGEFWGKWIISAVRACLYQKNEKLEAIIRNSVDKIIATANSDGYIGTYKNSKLILPCSKDEGLKSIGFRCDFCWNIWCQKYTLWGLIEAYELLQDQNILESAEKLAIQLVDTVREAGVNPCETGTFFGVASGSILKPMLLLYRHTGNEKILDFALSIADGFENDETNCIKLIKNSLAGIPVHLWNYNNPHAVAKRRFDNQKAYEMMSCFEGICELYRVTGEEKYLLASKKFFDLLIRYEYNRLLSVGFNDRFLFASSVEDAISEPCDIVHFLRLAGELYLLTGEVHYLDYYEDSFLNSLLASITRDGKWGARAIRSMSHHVTEYDVLDMNMKHNHCCVNNIPRAFEHASALAVTAQGDNLCINFYMPIAFSSNGVTVSIKDGYTSLCKTEICITSDRTRTVALRIPAWSNTTSVTCNGESHSPACKSYFEMQIPAGETVIEVKFDDKPQLRNDDLPRDMLPLTSFFKMRYNMHQPAENTDSNRATLRIGPMLLALSKEMGTDWETMCHRPTVNNRCKKCIATPIPAEGKQCAYRITFVTDEGEETLSMCDYASASNRFLPEDFSIFV